MRSVLIALLVVVPLGMAIQLSGNQYLFAVMRHQWAGIDDYQFFDNRVVPNGTPEPWPLDADYQKPKLSAEQERYIHDEMKSVAFVVLRDGKLLFEKYWDGRDAKTRSGSFSMAKSVVSILIGIAIDEGKLRGVEQTLGELLPRYANTDRAKVRLVDLLTMSSGFDYQESYNSPFAGSAKSYYTNDLPAQMASLRVVDVPGRVFHYQSSNQLFLAEVLAHVTGSTLSDYASRKLWKPLGAEQPALWSLDHAGGTEKAYCCMTATARDFARFGQLFLDGGLWHGRRLVSADYVRRSITPAPLVDETGKPFRGYGYSWWLLRHENHDTFMMRGILGQFVIVVPDQRLVIVRLGHQTFMPDDARHEEDQHAYIAAALSLSH